MKSSSLVVILMLFLCCCKQSDSTPPKPFVDFKFTTQYDSVISYYANSTYVLPFNVNVTSGDINDNPITFTVSNVPANITVSPASQVVTHLLGGIFTFNLGNLPLGNDTMTLNISCAATGSQNHRLVFKIQAPPDFSPSLAGTYHGAFDFCLPDSIINYTSVVSTIPGTPYKVTISNIKNLGSSFIIQADITNVVHVPLQSVGGYTIWGAGTFSHDNPPYATQYQMTIDDTLVHGTDTNYCTIHIRH